MIRWIMIEEKYRGVDRIVTSNMKMKWITDDDIIRAVNNASLNWKFE